MSNRETVLPVILDIWDIDDVKKTARIVARGMPIAFGVNGRHGRIYGFGGIATAFIEATPLGVPGIAELKSHNKKQRDFKKRPPVCLVTWQNIVQDADFGDLDQGIVEEMFNCGAHLVLPLKPEAESLYGCLSLPLKDGRRSQAFMRISNPPLSTLVEAVDEETHGGRFFATSANPTGQKIFNRAEQVVETWGANIMVVLQESEIELPEEGGQSSSMYNFSVMPEKVGVIRLASGDTHQRMVQLLTVYNYDQRGLEFDFTDFNVLE